MRPAACWFAAILVHWLGFALARTGTETPRPAPATDDLELVYLAGTRPIVLRPALHVEDGSLEGRWIEHLREWRAFLDRDGDGKLSEAEFRLAPSPQQILQQWQAGLYPRLGKAGADFRASIYTRVSFARADLRGADMRRADFEDCVFDGAVMDGAVFTREQGSRLALSSVQKAAISWRDEDGPEPSGG